jgi:hypothetical protein
MIAQKLRSQFYKCKVLHPRIYKTGATQKGQTELYDGVLLVFEVVDLQGSTLEKWLDTHIQESTADGTLQVTQPKKAVTLNGQPGFVYSTRGLGESTNYIIQKNAQSPQALSITMLVADPENIDFQAEVAAILANISLLK